MSQAFPYDPDGTALILGITFTTLGFTLYHFLNNSYFKKLNWKGSSQDNNLRNVLLQRLSGITIYGILPAFLFILLAEGGNLSYYTGKLSLQTFYWLVPAAGLLILVSYLNAGSESNFALYPEIRNREWNISLLFLSALSWIVYLLAYEFAFRGLLFIPAYNLFGFWPAVILNTGIYSLVHVPKSLNEGVGAVFLGFVLCLLVVKTGSFWIAFFAHVVLALSNEWFSISKNPDIKMLWK